MLICVYVNTVLSYGILFQNYFFLKRSQVVIYLQKNIHPKLSYISMYFQDVFFFLFDNITMLCFKGFFLHKKICVNSMLTDVTNPPGMEGSSLTLPQQQCPRLFASTNQLHHQNMVKKKISELKIYREQYRSLNFLSFISKSKELSQVLGHLNN